MESISTQIREYMRKFLLMGNYLLWLILSPSKFIKINKKEIKNVLIISLGTIGELLVLTTILSSLKKELNCKISFMISNESKNIFKNNPNISEVIINQNNFWKNVENLKKKKFDLVIITKPVSTKYSLMCLLAKIKYQIGIGDLGMNVGKGPPLFFNKNFLSLKRQHVIEGCLDIIRQIGINNKNPKMEFYFSKKDEKKAKEKLKKLKIKDYVVIHPGFGGAGKIKYPAKLWPLERYAKIVDFIIKNYKINVLITGSKKEKKFADKIIEKIENKGGVINVGGLFNLEELAYIISKTKLIIAPNTSVVHFASVFNSPLIELDGVGRPYQWKPWRKDKNYKILFHDEVCTGCNGTECRKKTTECMKAINVEEVEKAIRQFL